MILAQCGAYRQQNCGVREVARTGFNKQSYCKVLPLQVLAERALSPNACAACGGHWAGAGVTVQFTRRPLLVKQDVIKPITMLQQLQGRSSEAGLCKWARWNSTNKRHTPAYLVRCVHRA